MKPGTHIPGRALSREPFCAGHTDRFMIVLDPLYLSLHLSWYSHPEVRNADRYRALRLIEMRTTTANIDRRMVFNIIEDFLETNLERSQSSDIHSEDGGQPRHELIVYVGETSVVFD
jgi:hypothetical protein